MYGTALAGCTILNTGSHSKYKLRNVTMPKLFPRAKAFSFKIKKNSRKKIIGNYFYIFLDRTFIPKGAYTV
jgi:hypothetical protein